MSKVIAVSNQKGGVGKTVSCVNLGIGLAKEGKRVLLIDADPQGSMTISLGYSEPDEMEYSLATLMMNIVNDEKLNMEKTILHHKEGVDLIPANIELSAIEVSLVNVMSRELILRSLVEKLKDFYDFIIIDCMPSLGMLTINALACADSVLIPVQAAYLPVKGLQQLIKTIGRVKKQLNPKLRIEGILLTMVDNRTNYARDISMMVYDTYSATVKVFATEIPMSVRASEVSHEVIAYQIRQSFKPGEITPEEANRLGHELALRFTKGKYAFIVATHTDRAHVHNHIVFNSTSIDATRKFKNFWLSSFALQRVSDLICLENGLSVIAPKPYKERTKRTEYPRRVKNRDVLCEDIVLILQKKPESFDAFLQELQQLNYEIKYGKHISVRGKNQMRFIRLSSLEDGYTEADLWAHFLGQREHKPPAKQRSRTNARPFNLVIDIQSKLQSKGVGYQRWASVYNLKQMSKTLLFLRDHKIESMEQLDQMVMQQVEKRDVLLTSIQQSEKRLAEIGTLKKHIINYSKTRSTYEEYRKAGYSKKFLEAHREEITLHKAAKAAFDELGVGKLPKVKELSIEYAEVLTAKKQTYTEYRQVKNEAQELLIAQRNIASLYDAERKEEEQKRQKKNQIH